MTNLEVLELGFEVVKKIEPPKVEEPVPSSSV